MRDKNNVTLSKELVDLSNNASLAAQGFFVLAELDGYHGFKEELAKELKKRGWDITDAGRYEAPVNDMRDFMDNAFTSNYAQFRKSWTKSHLREWLSNISKPETAAFVTDPKNLSTLAESVEAAIETVKEKYGDPFAVKYGKRSLIKAAFDSVASKLTKTKTPETRLAKEFMEVAKAARKYSNDGFWHIQFFERVQEKLEKEKQWPMKDEKGYASTLHGEFSYLAQNAYWAKTQATVRYVLQDDNVPPRKPYRAAKDFMLERSSDIAEAVKAVSAELDRERAAPKPPKPQA